VLENCNWRRVCSPPLFYKMAQYAPEWWPTIRQNAGPVWSRIVTLPPSHPTLTQNDILHVGTLPSIVGFSK